MLDISLGNTVASQSQPTVPFNPMTQQFAESDTTFLLDPAGDAAVGLPVGQAGSIGFGGLIYATDSTAPNLVQGRFRQGIQAASSTNSYVWMPVDGVLPINEFTIEFWLMDTTEDWHNISNFNWNVAAGIGFNINASKASFTVSHNHNPAVVGTYTATVSSATLALNTYPANTWVSVVLTLKNGTLSMYLGKQGDTQTTLVGTTAGYLPCKVWGSSSRQRGLTVGASATSNSRLNIIFSDLRVSRTARTPGVIPSITGNSTILVSPTLTGKVMGDSTAITKALTGWPGASSGLISYPSRTATAIAKADDTISVVRDDKFLQSTPILAGGTPNSQYPSVGHSGQFCYDWAIVDRVMDHIVNALGAKAYITVDDNPSITGGTTTPFTKVIPNPTTPGGGGSQQPDGPNGTLTLTSATGAPTSNSFFSYNGTIWSYTGVSGARLTGALFRQGTPGTVIPAGASITVGDLAGRYSYNASGDKGPPNSITNLATIVGDMAYHILVELGYGPSIAWWGCWNAMDQPTEWDQTNFAAYNQFYQAAMPQIKAIDPTQLIGGPEVDDFQGSIANLITPFLQYIVANNLPFDQISWHEYSGGFSGAYGNQITLAQISAQAGLPRVPTVNIGEMNWQSGNNGVSPGAGNYPWCQPNGQSKSNNPAPVPQPGRCDYAANDFMIAYLAGLWCHYQHAGNYNILAYFTGNSTALFDQNNVPQGLYNLFKLYTMMRGLPEVTCDWSVADPGISTMAAKDPSSGTVYVLISNIHYRMLKANYPVTVDLTPFGRPDGTAVTAYVIDHNRSNAYDTQGGSVNLQSMTVPTLTSGKTSFSMGPRAVMLLVI